MSISMDRILEAAKRFMPMIGEESTIRITTIEMTPDGPLTTEKRATYQHGQFTVEEPRETE